MYKAETISKVYDALIVGSGIAGLLLADLLSSKGMTVMLACKGKLNDSNTTMAQGGLAAVIGTNPIDSPDLHLQDTLSSGAGLTDEDVARTMVAHGRDLVDVLTKHGVTWDRTNNAIDMALEGGHCRARVLHNKDATGRAITSSLIEALQTSNQVDIWEDAFALDLIVEDGETQGAALLIKGIPIAVRARHTILATGGLGQLFARTTNPAVATGDGIAMAYRAGARLIDMEFVQFHPTALAIPNKPSYLISEAVRGAGATLHDNTGRRFAFDFHKDGELATRDVVARAIYRTMLQQKSDHVMLDMTHLEPGKVESNFPNIMAKCIEYGIDPRLAPIPIAPAAHYFMGGVQTDLSGNTSVPRLYAIGECAASGLHGANRLASNSLLEGGVMALLLADQLTNSISTLHTERKLRSATSTIFGANDDKTAHDKLLPKRTIRELAFECLGLERNEADMRRLLSHFSAPPTAAAPANRATGELTNLHLLAYLVANNALVRQESRGAHQRTEFPNTDDTRFRRRYWVSLTAAGWLEVPHTQVLPPAAVPVNF